MHVITNLGRLIQDRWKRYHFDEAAFPDVAVAAMIELGMQDAPSLESIVDHVLTNDELGPQPQIAFGEPPMTLFQTEQFYIEVLPWLDGTTAVHQHRFSGAFTVLHGSSIHTRFAFEEQRHYSDHVKRGALRTTRVEVLRPGDVRPIHSGARFIHSLFHLDRPSVSLVARTRADALAGPQLRYSRHTGLAWDSEHKPQLLETRLKLLRLMASVFPTESFLSRALRLVEDSDAFAALQLTLELHELLDPETFAGFLEQATPSHADLLPLVAAEAYERQREANIAACRCRAVASEQRLFLALLLNVSERGELLQLVDQLVPGVPAADTVTAWLRSLTADGSDPRSSALGLRLDDNALSVFRNLLEVDSDEELFARLASEYSAADIEAERPQIQKLSDALKKSQLFCRLFDRAA